jgi:hypothetical protein
MMNPKMQDGRPCDGMGRMMDAPKMVMFDPPEGVELKGESGRAMVDWRMEDGQIMITAFDGVSLGSEQADKSEDMGESETPYKEEEANS